MLFVIHAIDADDAAEKRVAHYPAHFAFLDEAEKHGAKIVMSGPLTQDDEKTPVGSLLVIEAADHAAAERFHHAELPVRPVPNLGGRRIVAPAFCRCVQRG